MVHSYFKKLSYEDKFDRKYACWVKNRNQVWAWYKQKNCKTARRKLRRELWQMWERGME